MKRYKLCSSEAMLQRPRGKLNYSNGFTHFFTSFAFKLGLNFESLIVCILLLVLTAIKQSARRFGSWLILCYTKGKEKSSCLHKFENINQNQLCSCALQFSWKSVISCTTTTFLIHVLQILPCTHTLYNSALQLWLFSFTMGKIPMQRVTQALQYEIFRYKTSTFWLCHTEFFPVILTSPCIFPELASFFNISSTSASFSTSESNMMCLCFPAGCLS